MLTLEALNEHCMQMVACTPRSHAPPQLNRQVDPEDGIDDFTEGLLNERRNSSKVDIWPTLWRVLFPDDSDDDIKSPEFTPPIEIYEVADKFYQQRNILPGRLNMALQDDPRLDDDFRLVVVDKTNEVCQSFIYDVLANCRDTIGNQSRTSNRPRPPAKNPAGASRIPELSWPSQPNHEQLPGQAQRPLLPARPHFAHITGQSVAPAGSRQSHPPLENMPSFAGAEPLSAQPFLASLASGLETQANLFGPGSAEDPAQISRNFDNLGTSPLDMLYEYNFDNMILPEPSAPLAPRYPPLDNSSRSSDEWEQVEEPGNAAPHAALH